MTVTSTDIHRDVGEVWDAINGTTTTIVSALITRAENMVTLAAGTSSGYDVAVRELADAYVVDNVIGGLDGVSKTIGSITVGRKDLLEKRNKHFEMFEKALKFKGVNPNGVVVKFDMVDS